MATNAIQRRNADESNDGMDSCAICGERSPPNDHTVTIRTGFGRAVAASKPICKLCIEEVLGE